MHKHKHMHTHKICVCMHVSVYLVVSVSGSGQQIFSFFLSLTFFFSQENTQLLCMYFFRAVMIVRDHHLRMDGLQLTILQQHCMVVTRRQKVVIVRRIALVLSQPGQSSEWNVEVFESVQQEDADDDRQEAAEVSQNVFDLHGAPLLEEDEGGHHHQWREKHIVDRSHHGRVEGVQRTVEVVQLDEDASDDDKEEHVEHPVGELVVAAERLLEADADALAAHDGEGAEAGADGDVDQHVLVAVARGRVDDQEHRHDHHHGCVDDESWTERSGLWAWDYLHLPASPPTTIPSSSFFLPPPSPPPTPHTQPPTSFSARLYKHT